MPKCSYEGCERNATFYMYRKFLQGKHKIKRWLPFCDRCERYVARENLQLAREREAKNERD